MTVRERPGIYAEYRVKSNARTGGGGITVGVAAQSLGDESEVKSVISYPDALSRYGLSNMTALVKILFYNGAGKILAAPVEDGGYAAAFAELIESGADVIICDSSAQTVISDMKTTLESTRYCLGIAEFDGTAEQCVSLAQSMNFERLVICGNTTARTGALAAAMAGAVAFGNNPMTAFNGCALLGCGGLENSYTEQEIEALIAGGITPVENDGRNVCIVRGITTRTSTEGVSDKSLRELNTVLVAVNVLKSVNDALKIRFAGGRNDALTRGAIRSQVVVELEKKLKSGIIEAYGNVAAVADLSDETVCNVSFEFTAAHGLNSIQLTAYLEV